MKIRLLFGIGLLTLLLASAALTQELELVPAQAGGKRPHYSTLYKNGTMATMQGEVVSLGKTMAGNGRDYCLYLNLKTASGQIPVILAPESYARKIGLRFSPGEQVEVTGSQVPVQGKVVLIAAEIKRNGETIRLRELSGRTAWAVGDDWHVR